MRRDHRTESRRQRRALHIGPAAADEEFVDVLVEDEPEPVPMTPLPRARVLFVAKTGPRGPARAVEPVPLPVVDPQAEADLPEAGPSVFDRLARRRPVERPTTMFGTQSGALILSGLPVQEQRHLYGRVALQGLSFGPGTRSQEWSDSARCAAARCLLEEP